MKNLISPSYGLLVTLMTLWEAVEGVVSMDAAVIVCILYSFTLKD
jgi:hypothetical protein